MKGKPLLNTAKAAVSRLTDVFVPPPIVPTVSDFDLCTKQMELARKFTGGGHHPAARNRYGLIRDGKIEWKLWDVECFQHFQQGPKFNGERTGWIAGMKLLKGSLFYYTFARYQRQGQAPYKPWIEFLMGPDSPYQRIFPFLVETDLSYIYDYGFVFKDLEKIDPKLMYSFLIAARQTHDYYSYGFENYEKYQCKYPPRLAALLAAGGELLPNSMYSFRGHGSLFYLSSFIAQRWLNADPIQTKAFGEYPDWFTPFTSSVEKIWYPIAKTKTENVNEGGDIPGGSIRDKYYTQEFKTIDAAVDHLYWCQEQKGQS